MTNVGGDLLTNADTLCRGVWKIRLSPRFFGEFLERFWILVSAVFLKQSDCVYNHTRALCHPKHLLKIVLAGVISSVAY